MFVTDILNTTNINTDTQKRSLHVMQLYRSRRHCTIIQAKKFKHQLSHPKVSPTTYPFWQTQKLDNRIQLFLTEIGRKAILDQAQLWYSPFSFTLSYRNAQVHPSDDRNTLENTCILVPAEAMKVTQNSCPVEHNYSDSVTNEQPVEKVDIILLVGFSKPISLLYVVWCALIHLCPCVRTVSFPTLLS